MLPLPPTPYEPATNAPAGAEWHGKARSVGLSLSDLVRRSVGRVRTWTVAHTELERERTRELARIGSNLNQIARWANIHKENAEVVERGRLDAVRHLVLCRIEQRPPRIWSPSSGRSTR